MADYQSEIKRRRTFAIISHPDAGKTTITEKLLYHGGAIHIAGSVDGKAGSRAAKSDWMKMERERGISITSSVMQFDHRGLRINLLDTPGHKDFGEDTYRTLIAADSAAMLIDAAKGVEAQTRKLYEVCRLRKLPIFTFANKMDQEGKSPLELIDDVENTLQMNCYPVTWPIGIGGLFKGIYHRFSKKLYLYSKGVKEAQIIDVDGIEDPKIEEHVGPELFETFKEDLELLEGALGPFDTEAFLKGDLSPMTFGSAKYDWGVDLFMDLFTEHAPEPQPRKSAGESITPYQKDFSGFVFKIQANMDKRHRDRVAFLRVCSGTFDRGMKVKNFRTKRELRLAYANQFMAQDRETVDQAYAGDIVGINDSGNLLIGDTLSSDGDLSYEGIPRFSPEHFARINLKSVGKRKQLDKGISQLTQEGTVQLFLDPAVGLQDPILGVVGVLQFDIFLQRLTDEYGVNVSLDRLPYSVARWPTLKDGSPVKGPLKGSRSRIFNDTQGNPVILLEREWEIKFVQEENPEIDLHISSHY
jgi:peptide chain release factor 3